MFEMVSNALRRLPCLFLLKDVKYVVFSYGYHFYLIVVISFIQEVHFYWKIVKTPTLPQHKVGFDNKMTLQTPPHPTTTQTQH